MGLKETEHPSVATIVIAAYCAEATLLRALRSATAQTVPIEIVVVDDCSTDKTFAIAQEASKADPRIHVYRQSVNSGPAVARNLGIAKSGSPWIAVLDADDYMAPDRIAQLVAQAEAENIDFLADDLYRVYETDLAATDKRLWSAIDIGKIDLSFADFVAGNLHGRHGSRGEMGFLKPLMRRQFLVSNDLSYDPELRLAEDYLLYAKALAAGARFCLIDPCGYYAVYRKDSLSSQHSTHDLDAIVKADQALATHPALSHADLAVLNQHCLDTRKEWAWRRLIDAVHDKDFRVLGSLCKEPMAVIRFVSAKLLEQVWRRASAFVRRRWSH